MNKFVGFCATFSIAFASMSLAHADTVAWWHFDEKDPGATASANTITAGMTPDVYTTPYSLAYNSSSPTGEYLPTYAKPFVGLCVYDPVSGTKRTNRSSMKFRTASNSTTNAYYGGFLLAKPDSGQLDGCTGAITVEAFVCTTGGLFNTFAPIIASMNGYNWYSETWAIYEETNGTISIRFNGSAHYSGGNEKGTLTINDGAWHHIALTWDGSKVKIYVDYKQDTFSKNNSAREFSVSGTLSYEPDSKIRIGGYTGNSSNPGAASERRFNGLVDEVRISNVALTPDQFLRMQPPDVDPDVLAYVSFDPGQTNEYDNCFADGVDLSSCTRQHAIFRRVSGADDSLLDTETKAGTNMAYKTDAIAGFENVASYYQETNAVRKANYIEMPGISTVIRGDDGAEASYTVEFFYKTRSTMCGTNSNDRQVLAKFGTKPWWNVVFNANRSSKMLYVSYVDGQHKYPGSTTEGVDDGKWHHVAVVVDGANGKISFYLDYALGYSRSGTLPDVGLGNSIFFAAKENGEDQWFDGWLDDIRVTRRALTPDEFLTTHPVGLGPLSLFAPLENDYSFTCASNAALSVTGVGEARTNGSVPTFVADSRGQLLLDGTNGTVRVDNSMSAYMDNSRIVFPPSSLYELGSYTVEFWAKFTGFTDSSGNPIDGDAPNTNVGIMRFDRVDGGGYDWYLYQPANYGQRIQMAMNYNQFKGWDLPNKVRDGKWHHYAYTFQPTADGTNSVVNMFYDYADLGAVTNICSFPRRVEGHFLKVFEGSFNAGVVGNVDAIRFSRGVLDPSQFLARDRRGFVLIFR